jgi:hypothetical protein
MLGLMRTSFGISMLLLPLVSACQHFESRDYTVPHASRGDALKITSALRHIASETGLQKRSPTPYDSPMIALYTDRDYHVALRAGIERGNARIHVMRYTWPPPPPFRKADQLVRADMRREFGARFVVDPPPQVTRTIRIE